MDELRVRVLEGYGDLLTDEEWKPGLSPKPSTKNGRDQQRSIVTRDTR